MIADYLLSARRILFLGSSLLLLSCVDKADNLTGSFVEADVGSDFNYDYSKACLLQESLYAAIDEADWNNIFHKNFIIKKEFFYDPNSPTKRHAEYTYQHKGIYLEFNEKPLGIRGPQNYNIDILKLDKDRLPSGVTDKKSVFLMLAVQGMRNPMNTLSIECDAAAINFSFDGEATVSVELSQSHVN